MSSTSSTTRSRTNQDADHNIIFSPDKRTLNKIPQHSMDTENESPPQKSTSRILKHLESSLSPKYIEFNGSTGGQRSRYGREHKYKETDGFLPTEVVYAYQRVGKAVTTSEIQQNTNLIMIKPLGKHTTTDDNFYESPIEKLISKNKQLILGTSAEYSTSPDLFEKSKKRLFTSLTDDSGSILLSPSPQKILLQVTTPPSQPPNDILNIDKPTLIENVSPILKPVETSTPKNIEVITKPIRILQKVDNPQIIKSLQAKLSVSRKIPFVSLIRTVEGGTQIKLKQANSSPIKFVRQLTKVNNTPREAESPVSIITRSHPNEKLIQEVVREEKRSLAMAVPAKKESPVSIITRSQPIEKLTEEVVKEEKCSLPMAAPAKIENPVSIITRLQPIEKLIEEVVKEEKRSVAIAASSKKETPFNNARFKLSLKPCSGTPIKKLETEIQPVVKKLSFKSPDGTPIKKLETEIEPVVKILSIKSTVGTSTKKLETEIQPVVKKLSLKSPNGTPIKKCATEIQSVVKQLSLKSPDGTPTKKLETEIQPVVKKLSLKSPNGTPIKKCATEIQSVVKQLSLKSPDGTPAKKLETEIQCRAAKSFLDSPKPKLEVKTDTPETSIGNDLILFNSFKEGDVIWSRLASYPYWPCLIVPDEKKSCVLDTTTRKVHVKFFADNGRRCWVGLSSVLPYKGLDDFYARKAADDHDQTVYPKKKKKKKKRLVTPFVIPPHQLAKWESAVKEAEEVYGQPIPDRLTTFENILERNRDMKKQHATMMRQQRKASLQKRPRSPTPECPPFELIGFTPKKIKMESNSTDLATILNLASDIGKDVALSFLMNDSANLSSPGADAFYEAFEKRYLSNEENLVINKDHLEDFTKKLWNLKNNNLNSNIIKIEIKDEQLSENSIPDDGSGGGSSSLRSSLSSGTTSAPDTNMTEFGKNYLFRKLTREFVCRICFMTKNLLKCEGACNGWYHKACLNGAAAQSIPDPPTESRRLKRKPLENGIEITTPSSQEFLCNDCKDGLNSACFVCKNYDDENMERRLRCKNHACGRFYHLRCLKYFPQAKTVEDVLICPAHSCHTCISDDPKGKYLSSDRSSYVKCVICPASYHMDSTCIPAGTEFITAIQIICPKHREYSKQQNCNWCFICATGGNLVCCETCPTAFHPECLNIPLDEKGYICEECETGRMPLYGEIVWAKFSRYRWWPAQIIPPPAVPDRMSRISRKKADFCVKFFGSNNYAWINRGRVYLYQEGDWGKIKNSRGIEKQYENALIEAKTMYDLLNQQKLMRKDEKKDRLRPLPYIKIKINNVVPPVRLIEDDISDMNPCICDPKDEEPCGPYSGCLNRLLLFECHPKVCPARGRCMNQMFVKRIYPNLEVKRTDLRGWGLVTLENLKAGAFIVEYVGEVIDNDEFQRRVKKMQEKKDENYYFLTMIKDIMIDAGPKGNVARFMNHSCEPNCETQKWTVNGITRVGLFAIVDIPMNTELTFNYNLKCIGNEKKPCYCGASKCSGFIGEKSRAPQARKLKTRRTSSMTKKGG